MPPHQRQFGLTRPLQAVALVPKEKNGYLAILIWVVQQINVADRLCNSPIRMTKEEITQAFPSDRHFKQAGFVKLL
jgi:hypothetical protein